MLRTAAQRRFLSAIEKIGRETSTPVVLQLPGAAWARDDAKEMKGAVSPAAEMVLSNPLRDIVKRSEDVRGIPSIRLSFLSVCEKTVHGSTRSAQKRQ